MTKPLLSIRNLHVSFKTDEGPVAAVSGVSFDLFAGKTMALVGESGSGKTVISQTVLGILPANAVVTDGQIWFNDPARNQPVDLIALGQDSEERRAIRGGRISIIFQEPMSSLSPVHTIGNQIDEALRQHAAVTRTEAMAQTIEVLDHVGFPDPERAYRTYPFELSGGLRQRAMIAMALICQPALLIADEPTTALDVTIQAQILKLIKDLQAEYNMAVLFITHDLGVVANIADSMVCMYRGRVMEMGDCAELFREPNHPYLKALMHAVPTLHADPNVRLQSVRDIDVAAHLDGFSKPEPRKNGQSPDILEVQGLSKSFAIRQSGVFAGDDVRVIRAADDVSFTIGRGQNFAIVGESGSGKTTVSKMIMRAVDVDHGSVRYFGESGEIDVLGLSEQELLGFRREIQYIFQDPFGSLNPRMTVLDIVAEPMIIHGIGDDAWRTNRVKELLQAVGLETQHLRRYPHSFSGGQRQRIGIARALALEPRLLICDEPVSALDVSVQAQILNLLKDLQRQLGLSFLFISHNLAVVRYVADQIGVMCSGLMVERASCAQLFDDPQHPYTKALLQAVPEADLDSLLDFSEPNDKAQSLPVNWPPPFALNGDSGRMREVSKGHWVRYHQ